MKVFIFGAGASKPAGLPLGRDLYGSLRAYILKRSGEDDKYLGVACRLKDLEQQGVLGNSDDFELDLTRLDVRIKSKDAPPLFRTVRQELADILTDHFNALQNEMATDTARLSYFEDFAQTHIHEGDAIITFNYDCLLERVLHALGLWTIEDGYGFPRTLTNSSLEQPEGKSPCKVLKLHGSVGWVSSVINFDFFVQEEPLAFVGYPEARDSAYKKFGGRRATILPSYVKVLATYPLPQLWREAAERLREASEITIIGYSMPAADSAAWTLFLTNVPRGIPVYYFWTGNQAGLSNLERVTRLFKSVSIDLQVRKATIEQLAHVSDFSTI